MNNTASIREDLGDVIDELQVHLSDTHGIADLKRTIRIKAFTAKKTAVPAVEITVHPASFRIENFSMSAATAFVFDDDSIGRCTTNRNRFTRDESIDVRPLIAFSGNELCHNVIEINQWMNPCPGSTLSSYPK